jgi:MarR family transcriptional regulator, organic hydroperoxide resistance regulator
MINIFVCTNMFTYLCAMIGCDSKYCGCLYYSANALARIITKMAEDEFAVTGLTPSYAFLLMSIASNPGIQPTDLSREMLLTPSTITRLIEKLEHKGLVTRNNLGKITEVCPTEKGIALEKEVKQSWIQLYKKYSDILGEEQGKKLTAEIYSATKRLEL